MASGKPGEMQINKRINNKNSLNNEKNAAKLKCATQMGQEMVSANVGMQHNFDRGSKEMLWTPREMP